MGNKKMNSYYYSGITTNNLKDISVGFDDYDIVLICGTSGSGKSSLAFDTIASISENQYGILINDNKISVKYTIKEYGTVLAAATLKQLNFNVNPRSIIMTYFGLYPHISNIFSYFTHLSSDNFSLNGQSRCNNCNGIGYIDKIDVSLVVDQNKTIFEGPFRCWNNSYSDFFSQLLHNFCQENNINESKRFRDLNSIEKEKLLYSKGSTKHKISFKSNGRIRSKTSVYIGPILGLESERNDIFGINRDKYKKEHRCPVCNGSHLQSKINKIIINKTDVGSILTSPLDEVEHVIKSILLQQPSSDISYSCNYILRFIDACKQLNVSYLNLSRSICSLSGGELQRLRMVQLMLGRLSNLLIVLDEPTASLDSAESDSIIKTIVQLSKKNTVIVVDHNEKLRKFATRTYYMGPKSGKDGGYLISEAEFNRLQTIEKLNIIYPGDIKHVVSLSSEYVNYGDSLTIYEKALNGICGKSGIGKTTILKDILPYQLEGYKYITQKPIKAGRNSSVASFSGLLDDVRSYYARKTKAEKKWFSLNQDGACPKCGGKGCILVSDYYDEQIYADCEECNGTGYSSKTLSYEINGLNIFTFLDQSIDEICFSGISISKKFDETVSLLQKLGLGHLVLNQKTNTLSGGENQRLKLSQALGTNNVKIFGLDEPSKGLGRKDMINLLKLIYYSIDNYGKTFVVSEHNQEFLQLCSSVSILILEKGIVRIRNK